jgi:ribosomal-protein-alanine N-acetyltransferase
MKLTTARLVLREYAAPDFAAVHAFASDPRSSEFMDWGPNSEQDTRDFLDFCQASSSAIPRTGYTLALTLRSTGLLFGSISLTVHPRHGARSGRHGHRGPAGDEGDIGYTLHPDQWGHGYATEAARCLAGFGFSELGLARITATCRPENVASAGVLQKLGMIQVGHLKADRLIHGRWMDSLVFAMEAPGLSPERR